MSTLEYKTLSFRENGDNVQVTLLQQFSTQIPIEEVRQIAKYSIPNLNSIEFDIDKERAERKFSFLLAKYFDNLKTRLTGNKATYINRNSGIP